MKRLSLGQTRKVRTSWGETATPVRFGATTSLPAGLEVASGVVLTEGIRRYLTTLRAAVPSSIPLYVTSGVRNVAAQARAMLGKYKAGGADELYKVYSADAVVTKLVAAPKTVEAWSVIIQQATESGIRLSRHLGGGSFDLRTKTLTSSQTKTIEAAVAKTGGRALYETAPPHLHIDLPLALATVSAVETVGGKVAAGARRTAPVWVTLSVVGAAVLGILVLRRKRLAARSVSKE